MTAVGVKIDFAFHFQSFIDKDNHKLSYKIGEIKRKYLEEAEEVLVSLPSWLSFDGLARQLIGVPLIEDINTKFSIIIEASDKNKIAS